VAEGEPINP